ncbi:hypothetical protein ACKWRH_21120 [Bradyrhizobium sp. Pa8]|uniref:hypothetical protein n=1 Tax=Bradyrhizobium sp. Pa8 TaxID=3386552 RepID=UPI00403F12BE
MASLNACLDSIQTHIGFPRSRSTGIARRLQEAGILPSGAPGVAPDLDEDGVLDLIVALAADTELHTAVAALRSYHSLTPGGINLAAALASIPNAPVAVALLVEDARSGVAEARKSQIEVSCSARSVAIHKPSGEVNRFIAAGADPAHWALRGHHKSTALNAAAVADVLDEVFGKVS